MWRGIQGRCPNCGKGDLFKTYLKQNGVCSICSEDLSKLRADDGPAWLTILLTGHIMAPLLIYFSINEILPQWVTSALLIFIALALVFIILPRAKGLFIASIWLTAK